MKKLSILFSILLVISLVILVHNSTTSQSDLAHFYEDNNYVEGEIIVMFKNSPDTRSFLDEYSNIRMSLKEVLVPEMNIYLFSYDNSMTQSVDALLLVLRNNNVLFSLIKMIVYPFGKFIYTYFVRGGVLDGAAGFVYSFMMSFHSFLVRAKLLNL